MLNTILGTQSQERTSTEIFQGYSTKYTPNKYYLNKQKFNFDIQLATLGGTQRKEIEQFIKQGFSKSYEAKVSVSMPHLLALRNGTYKAALGIRSGKEDLFIEQYLSSAIEQQSVFVENNIDRKDIAEIGHLYSNNQRFTIPLFMITAVSLFYMNYKYMVFSGTEKVINLIAKSGVNTTHLCNAQQSKIHTSTDDWGTYYDTNPKVIAISLSDVITLIGQRPMYQSMFQSFDKQIAQTCKQLR
jgi:hypothetical protein